MTNAENDGLRNRRNANGSASDAQRLPESDAQLLRLMQMGDADAWQKLYQRYLPSAWRLAWQLVGDRQVADTAIKRGLKRLGERCVNIPCLVQA